MTSPLMAKDDPQQVWGLSTTLVDTCCTHCWLSWEALFSYQPMGASGLGSPGSK